MTKFLIVQTAFIGDVVLATPLIEKLNYWFPSAEIDFLVRKGNEGLLNEHPKLNNVLTWDKKTSKNKNLIQIISFIRKQNYDYVINVQRFFSSGIITAFSNSKYKIGFKKNPLSILFTHRIEHKFGKNIHEIDRNLKLIEFITDNTRFLPKLYPPSKSYDSIKKYQTKPYICISPTSVWFTKQFPANKWVEFLTKIDLKFQVYLLGAKNDELSCNEIIKHSNYSQIINLAGKLSFMESTALMQKAVMNYVNDSAPMHFASAINANCTAIYCSTIPEFGFGPLSDNSHIIEINKKIKCRPCGLHGFQKCPIKTFECAQSIEIQQLLNILPK